MQLHPPLRKNELKEDKILGKILDVLSNVSSSKVCQLHEVFLLIDLFTRNIDEVAFSALTLLVGRQKSIRPVKN